MRTLLLISLAILPLLSACDGGDDSPEATATPPASSPVASSSASPQDASSPSPAATSASVPTPLPAQPTPTPLPPVPTAPAALAGCPSADAVVCAFAVELQTALNAGDLGVITGRLQPETQSCTGVFFAVGDEIGCDAGADTTDPVVLNFAYGSDCCVATLARFTEALGEYVADSEETSGDWRVFAIIQGETFFGASPSVLLVRGTAIDAPLIDVGTVVVGAEVRTRGIIRGTLLTLFVPQRATLLPWP